MSSSFSSSSSSDLSDICNPFSQENIIEWFLSDSSSKRQKKKRCYIERRREDADQRLYNDYFSDKPTYNDDLFRRRFRMRRPLFFCIVQGVQNHDSYFQIKVDGTSRRGLSTLQKCTAAIRMLAYGVAADAVDEYLKIGESTTMACLQKFVRAVINGFGEEYMRRPDAIDIQRLLRMGQKKGIYGMLGSIDCMHW
jgi:Plant transposon protein